MADVSERPVVYAMNADTESRLCRAKYGRNRAGTTAYGSQPTWAKGSQSIPPEERWQAIAVMAYHLARRRGFVGRAVKYWLVAEAKVDAELAIQRSATTI